MQIDVAGLSDLIGLLYDASTQPSLWPEFCAQLITHIPSTDYNMSLSEPASKTVKVIVGTTATLPDINQLYFAHFHSVNPYYQRGLHKERTGYIGISHQVCLPGEFDETEFHQDFFRKLNRST